MKTRRSPNDALALVPVAGATPGLSAPVVDEKTHLNELARLINETHNASLGFAGNARTAARFTIEVALACGKYLRLAKVKIKAAHGQFLPWLNQTTEIHPRTAQNYMNLHKWVSQHQHDILERKPHSLRQLYILAGILPEDGAKMLRDEKPDELTRLRKFVRRTCMEAAIYIGYVPSVDILKALQPVVTLLEDVENEQTRENAKHVAHFGDDP